MKKLLIETNPHNILGKAIFTGCLGLWACLMLSNCTNSPSAPSEPQKVSNKDSLENSLVITRYISDKAPFKSCYFADSLGRDSLKIDGKKYTVSDRSRYRATHEPVLFGDTHGEGAIILLDPSFYVDTKTDSIVVLNACYGAKND